MEQLTSDQKRAFESLCSGSNVFLSGEAGTGKSYVIDKFIQWCEDNQKNTLVMAPTGIAALNIRDGSTIHRALGIPVGPLAPDEPLGRPRNVLKSADVIIIDEISMCRIDLFERVARMILDAQRATARKQIVLVGDFFQLPPVITTNDRELLLEWYPGNFDGYCFHSVYWKGLELQSHILHEVVRQKDDPEFAANLNLARRGDSSCADYMNVHRIPAKTLMDAVGKSDAEAIWLCPRNSEADKINDKRVSDLPGKYKHYHAVINGEVKAGDKPTADKLSLKPGARVMALKNEEGFFCNGSLGTVMSLSKNSVEVAFDDGTVCDIEPYKWSITKPRVVSVVDDNGERHNKIESEEIGSFKQIPLRIAYAVTIHKSQGQTFDKAVVGTNVFDAGQLYVGISRCRTFDGLQVYPQIGTNDIKARNEVLDFYDRLEGEVRYETISVPSRHVPAIEAFITCLEKGLEPVLVTRCGSCVYFQEGYCMKPDGDGDFARWQMSPAGYCSDSQS